LRTSEFLWQEGHTIHETAEEAQEETIKMLNVYSDMARDYLAIPVIKGRKTDKEKFAGAEATYTIEALMHDGKALQSGTSHNFGQGFAEAFGIKFTGRDGKLQYVHQTSWGLSTRIIGAIIMVHGDDSGLILPPRVAPIQVVIVPVAQHKEGVLEKAEELREQISKYARVKLDATDKKPGWKFSEYEMKGVPLRLEVGPKDIENNQVVLVRRDTREKIFVSMDDLEVKINELLTDLHNSMYEKALKNIETTTSVVTTPEEMREAADHKPGFIKAMWCGELECEEKIKEVYGLSSRCMPFEQEKIAETCICCGKKAEKLVYWGKAY